MLGTNEDKSPIPDVSPVTRLVDLIRRSGLIDPGLHGFRSYGCIHSHSDISPYDSKLMGHMENLVSYDDLVIFVQA
jgi:hypothetical protein